jgi:hypothetical protein
MVGGERREIRGGKFQTSIAFMIRDSNEMAHSLEIPANK